MKKTLLFLVLSNSILASPCGPFEFSFFVKDKVHTKKVQLCPIKQKDFVSPACLNGYCPQLKTYPIKMKLKRNGLKTHPGAELCKKLKGTYLTGSLLEKAKSSQNALCFFNDGNIVSIGYLYSQWKKGITVTTSQSP